MSPDGVSGSRNSHQVQDLQLVVYLLWQKLQIHTTERNRGQTLSYPHEFQENKSSKTNHYDLFIRSDP